MSEETIFNWIGALVFGLVGFVGVACLMACAYGVLFLAFKVYAKKFHNGVVNWQAVHQWVQSGRPQWKCGDDRVFRMGPTTGKYAQDGEIIEEDDQNGQ